MGSVNDGMNDRTVVPSRNLLPPLTDTILVRTLLNGQENIVTNNRGSRPIPPTKGKRRKCDHKGTSGGCARGGA